jgi:hypothetical protein
VLAVPGAAIGTPGAAERKSWVKATPDLDKRLDWVLRDRSLAEALDAVAKSAGLTVNAPGCLDDAQAVAGHDAARATWLDLRRAKTAEALDWLLIPARLQWSMADGAVAVTSARRGSTPAAWVYDASVLAVPSPKQPGEINDGQEQVKAVTT